MGDIGVYLPRGMFRNERLLGLARKIERCQNCGSHAGNVPAHSNYGEHGKGKGLKAHDCFFAALCDRCHKWLDNQGGHGKDPGGVYENTPADKHAMFMRAMWRTWLEFWRGGLVKVAP